MNTRTIFLALGKPPDFSPTAPPPQSGLNTPSVRGHRPLLHHDPALPEVKNGPANKYRHHLGFTKRPPGVQSSCWSLVGLVSLLLLISPANAEPHAARGVVALPNETGNVTVSWRRLASDPPQVSFEVHRRNLYTGQDF